LSAAINDLVVDMRSKKRGGAVGDVSVRQLRRMRLAHVFLSHPRLSTARVSSVDCCRRVYGNEFRQLRRLVK